jgi:hypothetical protein
MKRKALEEILVKSMARKTCEINLQVAIMFR